MVAARVIETTDQILIDSGNGKSIPKLWDDVGPRTILVLAASHQLAQ